MLWKLSEEISWAELQKAFTAVAAAQLGEAFLFVAVSYLFLTCYDALALRQLRLKMPYRITALASFTSYAVSFTLASRSSPRRPSATGSIRSAGFPRPRSPP